MKKYFLLPIILLASTVAMAGTCNIACQNNPFDPNNPQNPFGSYGQGGQNHRPDAPAPYDHGHVDCGAFCQSNPMNPQNPQDPFGRYGPFGDRGPNHVQPIPPIQPGQPLQ